jgi:hypothetical protein
VPPSLPRNLLTYRNESFAAQVLAESNLTAGKVESAEIDPQIL